MKTITTKEFATILANKLDLDVQIDNFEELKKFADDIYTQFVTEWDSLDDQAYCSQEVNVPERAIYIPTKVLTSVYEDANKLFGFDSDEENFFDWSANKWYDSPYDIKGDDAIVNYADGKGTSMKEFLDYLQNVAKQFDCQIVVKAGNNDEGGYGNHKLEWSIDKNGIKSADSYFDVVDDNGVSLMNAVYWLCANFRNDSFEAFQKLGVELRYFGECAQDKE